MPGYIYKKIGEKENAEEYKWITDIRVELYCFLSIENYKKTIERLEWQEYAYNNVNEILTILIMYETDTFDYCTFNQYWGYIKTLECDY